MNNNINFKGAFLLHQPKDTIKNKLTHTLSKSKKQVFNNFSPDGDVLYITRRGTDRKVAEILTHSKTKFEYYPGLSTKSGFDDQQPDNARKILASYKDNIITTVAELKAMFKLDRPLFNFSTRKKDNTLEKCMQTLNMDIKDYDVKRLNGFNEIYTKGTDKKLVATISEPGQYGFRYARIEPKTSGDEVERYAIRAGEKFSYINNPDETVKNGTTTFLKNYMRAVNANRITHNAKHQ